MAIKEIIKQTDGRRLELNRNVSFDGEWVANKPVKESYF
jgi:hypothetical protein